MRAGVWENVRDNDYYRSVLGNMGGKNGGKNVCFGTMDKARPQTIKLNSATAESWVHYPNPYTYGEVRKLLAECLGRVKSIMTNA